MRQLTTNARRRAATHGLILGLLAGVLAIGCGTQNTSAEPASGGGSGGSEQGSQDDDQTEEDAAPTSVGYEVVNRFPHDPKAYTQGLLFTDGRLLESTGRNGTSWVREVRLETGQVVRQVDLPFQLFGEGLALHEGELFQLTWKSGRVFVYDRRTFELKREHVLAGEGWGIVSDGKHLIISNGTSTLIFVDPKTFKEVKRVTVTAGGRAVSSLNELEMVEGELYANIWKRNIIARIEPENGKVRGWIDLNGLIDFPAIRDTDAVLNGIAYDAKKKRLFVTGKLWPTLYEIRVLDK